MLLSIRRLHRFLSAHLFYPIALSSLLGLVLFAGRILRSHTLYVYRSLVWNLFLAWLPYLFSLVVIMLYRRASRRWIRLLIPGLLWLAFFPNAPYLLTDFFHLELRLPIPIWYDILLLATFAWTGLFLAITSLRFMHRVVEKLCGKLLGWLFVLFALALSGLGLYLGRFSHWNSWDLLLNPRDILGEIYHYFLAPLDNLRFFGFSLVFTAFLLVCYLTFLSVHHMDLLDS